MFSLLLDKQFIRSCQTVSQRGCTILQSYQIHWIVPFIPPASPVPALSVFNSSHSSEFAMEFKVSHCISVMTTDVEHHFMCLLFISISSFAKQLFRSLVHFKLDCSSTCFSLLRVLYIFFLQVPFQSVFWKYFSPCLLLSFSFS